MRRITVGKEYFHIQLGPVTISDHWPSHDKQSQLFWATLPDGKRAVVVPNKLSALSENRTPTNQED